MKNFFTKTVLFLVAGALAGCAKPSNARRATADDAQTQTALSKSGGGGVMENRSRIVATVLEVTPQAAPGFSLRLHVDAADTVAGYASFAKISEEINAYPNFVRREGDAVDYADERNKPLLQAGTLKTGDQIVAEVYYRGGPGGENVWLLMSWQPKP